MLKIRLLINNFFYPLLALYLFCAVMSLVAVLTSRAGQFGTTTIAGQQVAAFPSYFWFTAGWVLVFSTFYFILVKKTAKDWKKYWKKQKKGK